MSLSAARNARTAPKSCKLNQLHHNPFASVSAKAVACEAAVARLFWSNGERCLKFSSRGFAVAHHMTKVREGKGARQLQRVSWRQALQNRCRESAS